MRFCESTARNAMGSHPTVMIDGRYLGPEPSGIGRYCRELLRQMQPTRPDWGWSAVVRHPGDAASLPIDPTVCFDAEPYGPATSLRLPFVLGRQPADLFHSPFHVLPVGLRCASVLTLHDLFNFTQPETSNYPFPISWLEWGYFLLAIPAALRRADRVVCVSQTTADGLVARYPSMRRKVRVIHHGVTEVFRRLTDEPDVSARCRQLVGGDEPFLLSVGGISPNKNHRRMLEAFAQAYPSSGPKWVLISRFGKPAALLRRARELGVADRYVSVVGASDEDVVALLNRALALVFCSLVEGFGMPVLEAMASGCPVLTSTVSCLPEIAGGAALLVDPTDVDAMATAMRRLVDEPGLREDLAGRGGEHARHFTWKRAADLHLDVYDEALRR